MIKVSGSKISLEMSHNLNKRQMHMFKKLGATDQMSYLYSFMGMSRRQIYEVATIKQRLKYDQENDKMSERGPGVILGLYNRLFDTTSVDHKPPNKGGKWTGVEIECLIPTQVNDKWLRRGELEKLIGLELRQAGVKRVSMKFDGSVHQVPGDENAVEIFEFTLLFNRAEGYSQLEKLCTILSNFGAYINRTCGLHVHFDYRHSNEEKIHQLGRRFSKALPVLLAMQPESRRGNKFCKARVSRISGNHTSRYYSLNLTSFKKHGSVECRLHAGTTNFEKIRNWIEIVDKVLTTPNTFKIKTFQKFLDVFSLPDYLVEYIEARLVEHSPSMLAEDTKPIEAAALDAIAQNNVPRAANDDRIPF